MITRADADRMMVGLAVWALKHGSQSSVVVEALTEYAEIAVATDAKVEDHE